MKPTDGTGLQFSDKYLNWDVCPSDCLICLFLPVKHSLDDKQKTVFAQISAPGAFDIGF